jgi:hypothetical protein
MTPVLYLIMRNDIPSMNPGKLAAQAAHVSAVFESRMKGVCQIDQGRPNGWAEMLNDWKEDRPFGTTICLGADGNFLDDVLSFNYGNSNFISSLVYDPTYPMSIPYEAGVALSNLGWHAAGFDEDQYLKDFIILDNENKTATYLRDCCVGGFVFGDKENFDIQILLKDLKLYP